MVSFAGIGSGLDLTSLIDGLVNIERLPINQIEVRKADANRQLTNVGALMSLLNTMDSAAQTLDESAEVRAVKASTTNESFLGITASEAALIGNYDVRIDNLAKAQVTTSNTFAANTAGTFGTGTIGITVGTDVQVDIVLDGSEDLDDIATKINDSAARASASVVFDGTNYRLMVGADDVGTNNAITFQENSVVLGLTDPANVITAAEDSQLQLNGIAVTRNTNTISDLLPGVTFALNAEMAPTDATVTVRVDNDPDALQAKVEGLTTAVNNVINFINDELGSGSAGGTASSLQGDSTLQGLQRRLSSLVSSAYPNGQSSLSLGGAGINLGDDGALSVDGAAFAAALTSDPTGLSNLLAGDGVTSFTAIVKNLVTEYTQSGTGILVTKENGLRSRIDDFDIQIEKIEDRADRLEVRLRRTFAALDVRMAELNNQASYLASAFSNNQGQG